MQKILKFEPLLETLNWKAMDIRNMNEYTLDKSQVKLVSQELKKGDTPFMMEYFGFNPSLSSS